MAQRWPISQWRLRGSRDFDRAVIVTVVAVRVMQVAVDQIIDVVAVRHRFMPATRSVHVASFVPGTTMVRCAAVGITLRYFNHMLIDMVAMRMMQMTVVKVINVVTVAKGRMPATGTMLVGVIGVVRT